MIKSYCGMNCEKCIEYFYRCPGCSVISGKPKWAKEQEDNQCPIYVCCVMLKEISSCGICNESICRIKKEFETNR